MYICQSADRTCTFWPEEVLMPQGPMVMGIGGNVTLTPSAWYRAGGSRFLFLQ